MGVFAVAKEVYLFIKDGKVWLATTSHEFENYINTEDELQIEKLMQIEGLKIRL